MADDIVCSSSFSGFLVFLLFISLLRSTLSSPFPVIDVQESLLLILIDKLQLGILAGNLGEIDFLRIVADHGRPTETLAKIFCACADASGIVGGLEDGAAQAGQRREAGDSGR